MLQLADLINKDVSLTEITTAMVQGLSLLGVAATVGVVAAPVAWVVAKWTADHSSKRWLQTHKAELDRDLETHKASLMNEADRQRLLLKRQELMFDREVLAAQAYYKLYYKLYPKAGHPDPDWSDAQIHIAESFGLIETKLDRFLSDHSVAISEETIRELERVKNIAAQGNFGVGNDTGTGEYELGHLPSKEVQDAADEVFKGMGTALKMIKQNLQGGTLS